MKNISRAKTQSRKEKLFDKEAFAVLGVFAALREQAF